MSEKPDQEDAADQASLETALNARLKIMYAAMNRSAGTALPDLDSLPRSGRSEDRLA